MAKKATRKPSRSVKDLPARARKAAAVKGGAESLTTVTLSKEEFAAQFRGGMASPATATTTSSTSSSRSPAAFSS